MYIKKLLRKIPWAVIRDVTGILIGSVTVAISINSLILPNQIADGGITGIAIILHYLFDVPVGTMVFLLNVPLFLLGLKMVGRQFLLYSILGVSSLSAALTLTAVIPPLTANSLLATIFGGVLTGIGMGIIFRSRGSLGGTDILAVFFSRTTPFSVGQILLGIDALIFLVTAVILSVEMAMYAMIYMFIATKVIDLVQEGMNHSKAVLVVTNRPQEIAQDIMCELERGVTFFNAEGAYSGQEKKVVYCIVSRTELSRIKEIVRGHDHDAFLAISEVHEVVGEGFSQWKGH